MSTDTPIEWAAHTFNPWWGCTKVHTGCKHCYAESMDSRWGGGHWGPRAPRRMILGTWAQPAKWSREAERAGRRAPVFCASMADLYEDFTGQVVDQQGKPVVASDEMAARYGELLDGRCWTVPALRRRTHDLVRETPWLDWMFLTKRPENVERLVPPDWAEDWPDNVTHGTSPCDQQTAVACIPPLLTVPGRRFLSIEPLLGQVDLLGLLSAHAVEQVLIGVESRGSQVGRLGFDDEEGWHSAAADLLRQCRSASIPALVKQIPLNGRLRHARDGTHDWPDTIRDLLSQEVVHA